MPLSGVGNDYSPGMTIKLAKEAAQANLVAKTIDGLNTNSLGEKNADYDFQTAVLSAATLGKGSTVNEKI